MNPVRPQMFPCARQVSIIQVGADETLDLRKHLKYINPGYRDKIGRQKGNKESVPKPIIKRVSEGLNFTEEVSRLPIRLGFLASVHSKLVWLLWISRNQHSPHSGNRKHHY